MRRQFASFPVHQLSSLSPKELIRDVEKLSLLNEQTAYYMIITYLLMGLFHGLFKNQLKKYGLAFEDFDLQEVMADVQEYDPTAKFNKLSGHFKQLDEVTRRRLSEASYNDLLRMEGVDSFKNEVQEFMDHFGHLSESGNDFSSMSWRENPDAILNMIINYPGRGDHAPPGIHFDQLEIPFIKKMMLKPIYAKARYYRVCREAVGRKRSRAGHQGN